MPSKKNSCMGNPLKSSAKYYALSYSPEEHFLQEEELSLRAKSCSFPALISRYHSHDKLSQVSGLIYQTLNRCHKSTRPDQAKSAPPRQSRQHPYQQSGSRVKRKYE